MKPFSYFKWRSFLKKTLILGVASALVVGCGSDKKNEAEDTNNNNNVNGTSPIFNGNNNVGQNAAQYWNQLKSQYQCSNGGRMEDMTFTLQGQGYGGSIQGALQNGASGGSVSATYAGVNLGTRDLVFITQMSGGQYNVVLSLCTWSGNFGYGYPQQGNTEFIGPNAGMSNFRVDYMTLSNSYNCPAGKVLDGWVTFYSQTYGGEIPTRFTQVSSNCN